MNLNDIFVIDIKNAIENKERNNEEIPSTYFKPSGMQCERSMYYVGKGFKPAKGEIHYNWLNAADTGSRRHEGIQQTLMEMSADPESNWIYVDVGEYIQNKHNEGKCLDVEVGNKKGAETHLYNKRLNLSFLCDGIVQYKPTGEYLLFEFKNKKSAKFQTSKLAFPQEHYDQVVVYCDTLDLTKVLLLMEDRDTLELSCPELFEVTQLMKDSMEQKILKVIECIKNDIVPDKPENANCYFCPYKIYCN